MTAWFNRIKEWWANIPKHDQCDCYEYDYESDKRDHTGGW